jgi:hypothetical protein
MAHFFNGLQQRLGQHIGAVAVALEQVKRHALGGFRADAGQTA